MESIDTSRAARPDARVRLVGLLVAIVGAVMVVAGVTTYVVVQQTLAAENISVSDDADWFAGNDVAGPLSAFSEAATIAEHAEKIADGKTYAELAPDDPRRESVMTASFLRASLFTSVVAFGVAALVVVLGAVLVALGWALRRLA